MKENITETKKKILRALEDKKKTINLLDDAKKLSNKKLKEEIEGIEQHIAKFSYGRYELMWREALYQEAERRRLE